MAPITVDVLYSNDSGVSWNSIAAGQPANGTYVWTVPAADIITAKIKVKATDNNSTTAVDESAVFTISPPVFDLPLPVLATLGFACLVASVTIRRKMKNG
jgi:hypothetical protein